MAFLRVVAIDGIRLLEIDDDEIEIAIPVEIGVGRAIGHAHVIEPPCLADVVEFVVVRIAIRAVLLLAHFAFLEKVEHVLPGQHLDRDFFVRVVHVPRDAVREIQILPAVAVEVREFDRPRPVRARGLEEPRALEETARAGVDVKRVLHDLHRRTAIRALQVDAAHDAHRGLRFVMRRGRHVRDEQVRQEVVVHVAEIRAHREPRAVRNRLGRHVGEGAVAVVAIEFVGRAEIVRDVDVRRAVAIVIPPRHRQSVAASGDPRRRAHVFEDGRAVRRVAFIVVKAVGCAGGLGSPVVVIVAPELVVFLRAGLHRHGAVGVLVHGHLGRRAGGILDAVREQIHVEPAIAVVVRKRRAVAAIDGVEPARLRDFLKDDRLAFRTFSHVEEKLVGALVVRDVNVRPTVAIHIADSDAATPADRILHDAAPVGDVLELQLARLPVELVRPVRSAEENVRLPVAIEIRHGHAAACHAAVVEEIHRMIHIHFVHDREAGVVGAEFGEKGFPGAFRGRLERLGG